MNVQRSVWLALPLALLFAVGCNQAAPTGEAAEPVAAAPAAVAPVAEAGHHHKHHRHQGPARMLFRAARSLDLADGQKATIDQLAQQLRGQRGAGNGQQGAARAALVEGVRAGNVDVARVESLQSGSDQVRQARRDREATALNGLWAALQPAQRTAVVASVREKMAARAARWAEKKEARPAGQWQTERLARLTNQLDLDAAQQSSVAGIMAKSASPAPAAMQARHEAMKERNDALLTAFAGDSFDAKQLLASAPEGMPAFGQHRAEFIAQLVPILRADQREKLASSMESERL